MCVECYEADFILFRIRNQPVLFTVGENLEIIIKNTLQLNKTEESTIPNSPTVRKVQNSKA